MIMPSSTTAYIVPIWGNETTSLEETTNSLTELASSLITAQLACEGDVKIKRNRVVVSATFNLNI
jgi:hypothetical protein